MTAEDHRQERTARTIASAEDALAGLLKVGTELRHIVDTLIHAISEDRYHERAPGDE